MIQIQSHKPTTAELFPFAYQQDLLKIQSEHFVSNALSNGNVESGYKNMPIDFTSAPENLPLIVSSKPPSKYIGTFLKNNWKPLLVVALATAAAVTAYNKLKQRKEKKLAGSQIPKNLYYKLPKKSI